MMDRWKLWRGSFGLERALRADRPRPRKGFVASLSDSLVPARAERRVWSKTAFAAALTVFMLGTAASFGGASYAAVGATNAFHAVKRVTAVNHPKTRALSAASDEYSTPSTTSGSVKGVTKKGTTKPKPKQALPPTVPSGQLPFTGLSLLTTSVLGFALIGLGFLLRCRERDGT